MTKHEKVPGVGAYGGPAGGWGALQAVARALRAQMALNRETRALRRVNQPQGFDCPGCAWPDPRHASSFEFCENGAKAVNWEATASRADLKFFAKHTVTALLEQSDYWLEYQGRLTEPMAYDAETDRYKPIAWDDAYALIGRDLQGLSSPDQAEFYTSGRTSTKRRICISCSCAPSVPTTFPIAPTCATRPAAWRWRRVSGSAKAP